MELIGRGSSTILQNASKPADTQNITMASSSGPPPHTPPTHPILDPIVPKSLQKCWHLRVTRRRRPWQRACAHHLAPEHVQPSAGKQALDGGGGHAREAAQIAGPLHMD
jgi:hypothetical protein